MADREELSKILELATELKSLATKCISEYGDQSEEEPQDEADSESSDSGSSDSSAASDAAPAKGKNLAIILALKKKMGGKY